MSTFLFILIPIIKHLKNQAKTFGLWVFVPIFQVCFNEGSVLTVACVSICNVSSFTNTNHRTDEKRCKIREDFLLRTRRTRKPCCRKARRTMQYGTKKAARMQCFLSVVSINRQKTEYLPLGKKNKKTIKKSCNP